MDHAGIFHFLHLLTFTLILIYCIFNVTFMKLNPQFIKIVKMFSVLLFINLVEME